MTTSETHTGRILHLQRLSTEDGPGIRTTVFFKGCSLHCAWCHNPEAMSPHFQMQWLDQNCICCDTCLSVCPLEGLYRDQDGLHIDRLACLGCGVCAEACPANAMQRLGEDVSPADLAAELLKDQTYFETSGGGVTLSGGEPAQQASFALELLAELRKVGIKTALDTCGLCSHSTLEKLAGQVDLVLYDLKLIDPEQHRHFTGQDNHIILDNLRWLGEHIREHGRPLLWVRTPLIPDATDSPANLAGIGAFLAAEIGPALERWELCAFNNLCRDKYRRLGLEWAYQDVPLYSQEQLEDFERLARQTALPAERVMVSGAARMAE